MRRVGLFGGSFNPIHLGHLLLAEEAKEKLLLQRIIFIPTFFSPFKKERRPHASHRYQMVRLAVRGNPAFSLSDIEIRRRGPSYTIETVRSLRKKMPKTDFFLLVGSDGLKTLPAWKEAKALFRLCHVVIAERPRHPLRNLPKGFKKLEIPQVDISAANLRDRIRKGKSIAYQVPAGVERYIVKHRLYR